MYSSPPIHGALLVRAILASPTHYARWQQQLQAMAARIHRMRSALRDGLEAKRALPLGSWSHITHQIGMFSFTGL